MPEQMTKQDAIETLEIFRNDYTREGSAMCRAIDIALDALRQPTIKPKLIERDNVIAYLNVQIEKVQSGRLHDYGFPTNVIASLTDVKNLVRNLPTIEPEVRHGHWVLTRDEQYEYCHCSECGYDTGENWMIGSEIPYCSQCGSKNYDGGADNGY